MIAHDALNGVSARCCAGVNAAQAASRCASVLGAEAIVGTASVRAG